MVSSPLLCRDFVGRLEELNFLVQQFRTKRSNGCITIPIAGHAGMGKTRLISELGKAVADDDARIVVGQCLEYVQSAYLPFRSIFTELFGGTPRLRRDRQDDNSDDRLRYFKAIANQFGAAAQGNRLIVVVEDIHWADTATLDLIDFLTQAPLHAPFMLLVTYRDDDLGHQPRLVSLLANLARCGPCRIELTGLTKSATTHMLHRAIDGKVQMTDGVIDDIAEMSEGNPLFAEELLRSIVDHGASNIIVQRDMPLTMRSTIAGRLSELQNADRDILVHAAVIGRSFDVELLRHLTGHTREEITRVLHRACDLQIVSQNASLTPTYEFRHALIRATLESELLPDLTRQLHEAIAIELKDKPNQDEIAAELAYHWAASGNRTRAAEYYERSGDLACAVFAYTDGLSSYRKALQLDYVWDPARPHIFEKLARALSCAGSEEPSLPWWRKACDFYEGYDATDRLTNCLLEYARQCSLSCDNDNVEIAVRRIHRLLDSTPENPLHWFADLVLARHQARLVEPERALQTLADAERRHAPLNGAMSAMLHEARAACYSELGREDEFIAEGNASVELASASNMPELLVQTNQLLGINMAYYGRTAEAVNRFRSAITTASEHGYLWRAALARLTYAHTLVMLGELVEASRLVSETVSSHVEMPKVRLLACSLGIHLGLLTDNSKLIALAADEAMIELAFATEEPDGIAGITGAYSELYSANGQPEKARALIKRAARFMKTAYGAWPMLLQVAYLGDDVDVAFARVLFKRFLDYSSGHVIATYYALFEAIVARRALDSERARRFGRRAATKLKALGQRYLEALAHETAENSREALRLFREVGATRDVRRMEYALGDHRAEVSTLLTHRQREIAKLVCAGKTNREVASQLYISEKTVEHHLAAIFSRVGVATRHQLIARTLSAHDSRPAVG